MDIRAKKLAKIMVHHSLKIKKKDRVVISTSNLNDKDLIKACYEEALNAGAYPYLDVMGTNMMLGRTDEMDIMSVYFSKANDDQLKYRIPIYKNIVDWGNKFIRITSINNYSFLNNIDAEKIQMNQKKYREVFDNLIRKDWVLTYTPTYGLAQNAGLSFEEMVDFYYKSVLVDYNKMKKSLIKISNILDRGKKVRIVGYNTDITFGISGRLSQPCYGEKNIPDGEVFIAPLEDKTEGYIYYDFPGLYSGKVIRGIYLEFRGGRVVKYSSETNQKDLDIILNTDSGAKRIGELAIGANYNIKKYMYNTLFDEKMGGTIHTALGKSYEEKRGGGKNKSAIHWDIVKDTRKKGSRVYVDNKLVLKDGKILV